MRREDQVGGWKGRTLDDVQGKAFDSVRQRAKWQPESNAPTLSEAIQGTNEAPSSVTSAVDAMWSNPGEADAFRKSAARSIHAVGSKSQDDHDANAL